MAEKLKSILRRIHWSLLLRAAVFALVWFFFPFWLFCLVALYLYFIPFFQAQKLFAPFFALMVLVFIQPPSLLGLLVFGALFYYLLLIKDLLLIDRRSAFETLVLALSFLLIYDFYRANGLTVTGYAVWYALLAAILVAILMKSFLNCFSPETDARTPFGRIGAWSVFLIVWQFLLLGLLLPLNADYQSIVAFLAAAAAIDLNSERILANISNSRLFAVGATMAALLVIVLAAARWTP